MITVTSGSPLSNAGGGGGGSVVVIDRRNYVRIAGRRGVICVQAGSMGGALSVGFISIIAGLLSSDVDR